MSSTDSVSAWIDLLKAGNHAAAQRLWLGDSGLRIVALAKMEGYRNDEIATQLGCGLRTVERKLQVIRGLWEQEVDGS